MLTRLKVTGFKNLVDVDVRFGPFTCIAGANGVGKSNLFDAIRFLSTLADRPLVEAAQSIRDDAGKASDIRNIFHRYGNTFDKEMSFETEMIVPKVAMDDLGQEAKAILTLLRYKVVLGYQNNIPLRATGNLELRHEELTHIPLGEAKGHLAFEHEKKWRESVITRKHRSVAFISTENEPGKRIIKMHQDGGSSGRPGILAGTLPRTALSSANASESPTALLARREMQSWMLLQLEPSALRRPDEFLAPPHLAPNGAHLPATLYRLANQTQYPEEGAEQVYSRISNRLAELIRGVHSLEIERDEKRELLTLHLTDLKGTVHPARDLSDGTLRFLALSVLEQDPEFHGVLCLEEPENGIHPERIPSMLRLLKDIAVDTREESGADNPLRQVIVNTHSPTVVQLVPADSLLVAEPCESIRSETRFTRVRFSCLPDTWRSKIKDDSEKSASCSLGQLLAYLNPAPFKENGNYGDMSENPRVVDRPDVKDMVRMVPGELFSDVTP